MSDESWLHDSWIETVDLHDGDGDGEDADRFHLRVAGSEAVNDCEGFSGGMLWPAAYVLARWLIDYLARCPPADGATGLELGAGCGLGGIAMARCSVHAMRMAHTHTRHAHHAHHANTTHRTRARCGVATVLTDHHEAVLSNLRHNAALNGVHATVQPLRWETESESPVPAATGCGHAAANARAGTEALPGTFDFVIASDVMYDASAMPALAASVQRTCRGLFLAVSATHERAGVAPFVELMRDAAGWTVRLEVAPARYTAGLGDEYTLICAQRGGTTPADAIFGTNLTQ